MNLEEMRNELTTASYVKNCIGSIRDLRDQFNCHLQNILNKVTAAISELRTRSDGYLGRVENMLKGELTSYANMLNEENSNEEQSNETHLIAAYRKQADKLVECKHHRGQLVAQLDSFEKKISDEQKEIRKGLEEQSNTLVELCQQFQIAMETGVERFKYRQSSKLDPISHSSRSSWRQEIFQPTAKTNLSADINQELLDTNPKARTVQ